MKITKFKIQKAIQSQIAQEAWERGDIASTRIKIEL